MEMPPMDPEPNYEAVGDLVKTWVLGEDRLQIPDPKDPDVKLTWPKPVSTTDPKEIQALRDQFTRAQTRFALANTVTQVVVVESSDTCFVLKLPAAQAIRDCEKRMKTEGYKIPSFYSTAVSSPPTTLAGKMRLNAQHIGDYTISNCAGG